MTTFRFQFLTLALWACAWSTGVAQTITTYAGQNGRQGFSGEGGPAAQALLNTPSGIAMDAVGNLYIADLANMRVRKLTPDGMINTFAGNGKSRTDSTLGDGSPATSVPLFPKGVAVDNNGVVYIADLSSMRIRRVTPDGIIGTVAGGGFDMGNNIPATTALLTGVEGLTVDSSGNLYFGDGINQVVRKVTTDGILITVAGMSGSLGSGGDGGPATQAQLAGPLGVAVNAAGNIYISDHGNAKIRKVTPDGKIATIAGTGNTLESGNGGPAEQASLSGSAGSLPDGTIDRVAGGGLGPNPGDGGLPALAFFQQPIALALDAGGNIFIDDVQANAIRKVSAMAAGAPQFTSTAVVNAASFQSSLTAGGLFTIFGTNLAGSKASASSAPWPASLGGASVTVNGKPAPLYYASPTQINGQIPWEAGTGSVTMTVTNGGMASGAVPIMLLSSAPGIFQSANNRAVVQNQDGSVNTASNPAATGSVVVIYGTGGGTVNPPVTTGVVAPNAPLSPVSQTSLVSIGGKPAATSFLGMTPGLVGVIQANVTIPSGLAPGDYPAVISVGTVGSNLPAPMIGIK